MKEQLCRAFCDDITVRELPFGVAVSTGFAFPDGDRIGFYVKREASGLFEIQDSGLVFPNLEASGLDLSNKSRAEAFADLQAEYGVTLDEDDREFRLSRIAENELPSASLRFISFMLRVNDLLLLSEDRVASTFRLDVQRMLTEQIGDRAVILEGAPISPDLSDFVPDFVVRHGEKPPVAVFLGTSDARILEALYVQMRAEHEEHLDVQILALLEREKSITAKVRQQATNRLSGVLHFRGDEAGAIGRVAKIAGVPHALH
ncbi:DUF1828 domain-containing protein [Sphingomonas pokkalii]|uniref:DUF1828 domain-containing protein n=1 Tax=Sphingomonas pokkalii TaxID=2175090 RepID=A0A2U0SCA9_9SPHN|nr:DUF1828 domain-containing protein [Sphingomonas pokkalii]PVX28944.1 hypothetical protein DD559_06025 [Sphingomonas pokkalii]